MASPGQLAVAGALAAPAARPAPLLTPTYAQTGMPYQGLSRAAYAQANPGPPVNRTLTNSQATRLRYAPMGGIGMTPNGMGNAGTHMGTGGMY